MNSYSETELNENQLSATFRKSLPLEYTSSMYHASVCARQNKNISVVSTKISGLIPHREERSAGSKTTTGQLMIGPLIPEIPEASGRLVLENIVQFDFVNICEL